MTQYDEDYFFDKCRILRIFIVIAWGYYWKLFNHSGIDMAPWAYKVVHGAQVNAFLMITDKVMY